MEQFLNQHDYMFKFDIKQSYHHIDIHKPRQKISWFFMGGWGKLVILYLLSSRLD